MEFKGTKGKWLINTSHPNKEIIGIHCGDTSTRDWAEFLLHNARDEETQLANAKLIVCAPEMLELLEKIEQDYDCGTDTYKALVELIKKATE